MASEFITRVEHGKDEPYTVIFKTDDADKYKHIEDECRKMIGHAKPTVDAVPVRHGKWILDEEFIDCSECRREKWSRVPYESLVKGFKYCPNCGARMDEE